MSILSITKTGKDELKTCVICNKQMNDYFIVQIYHNHNHRYKNLNHTFCPGCIQIFFLAFPKYENYTKLQPFWIRDSDIESYKKFIGADHVKCVDSG